MRDGGRIFSSKLEALKRGFCGDMSINGNRISKQQVSMIILKLAS